MSHCSPLRWDLQVHLATLVGLLGAALGGCRQAVEQPVAGLVVVRLGELPADPLAPAWQRVPEFAAGLLLQDMVEPRLTEPTATSLRAQAATDGSRLALRLRWDDPTADRSNLIDAFADACGVQLPATIGPTIPAPQMGEPGLPVEITYWNAAWQAMAEGQEPALRTAYPNATVDHYPFEAASLQPGSPAQQAMELRYSPARAVGNPVAPPRNSAVQELRAEGPGTLTAAETTAAQGRGVHDGRQWVVVLVRPLPKGFLENPQPQVAFAVWEGGHKQAGARKMRTAWISMTHEESAP